MKELTNVEISSIAGGGFMSGLQTVGHGFAVFGSGLNRVAIDLCGGVIAFGITSKYFPLLDSGMLGSGNLSYTHAGVCTAAAWIGWQVVDYVQVCSHDS